MNGKPKCLLLTPLSEEFRPIRQHIADALQDVGIEPVLLEDFVSSELWFVSVLREIERADLIIADITGNNSSVMYELGFAHALRKPVLLISQRGAGPAPSDLKGHLYFVYDPTSPVELRNEITVLVQGYLRERVEAA